MYILLAIVGLVASASAKDVIVGNGGNIIYEQNITAAPTIWRQVSNLTINVTSPQEVISRIVVIDNREGKDGEAAIVEGGLGHQNVTIELKSPAVFRGYNFEIQVYAKEEDIRVPVPNDQQKVKDHGVDTVDKQIPKDEKHDQKGLLTPAVPTSSTPLSQDKVQHPAVAAEKNDQKLRENRDTKAQIEPKPLSPTPVDKSTETVEEGTKGTKGFNPMTNDEDWQSIVDKIFANKNNSTEKTSVDEKPLKPVVDFEEEPEIDINGHDAKDIISPKEVPAVKKTENKS